MSSTKIKSGFVLKPPDVSVIDITSWSLWALVFSYWPIKIPSQGVQTLANIVVSFLGCRRYKVNAPGKKGVGETLFLWIGYRTNGRRLITISDPLLYVLLKFLLKISSWLLIYISLIDYMFRKILCCSLGVWLVAKM